LPPASTQLDPEHILNYLNFLNDQISKKEVNTQKLTLIGKTLKENETFLKEKKGKVSLWKKKAAQIDTPQEEKGPEIPKHEKNEQEKPETKSERSQLIAVKMEEATEEGQNNKRILKTNDVEERAEENPGKQKGKKRAKENSNF